jgi:GT2 family glycosyltransferase
MLSNCTIVILSHKPENCRSCVRSIIQHEPDITPDQIVVVDDGGKCDVPATFIPGQKPFVFARNANIGMRHADSDVILLNDDTELSTSGGFSLLAKSERRGITSARVIGPWAFKRGMCSFVCVFIPKETQQTVGELDEQFVKYGYEDDDYCRRVVQAKQPINLCDKCVVTHYHPSRSTFHGENNLYQGDNMVAFDRKWGINRAYTWPEHLEQIKESK